MVKKKEPAEGVGRFFKRDLTFTSHHTFTYSSTKKKRTNIDAPLASTTLASTTPTCTNGLCVYPPTIIRFGLKVKRTKFKTIDSPVSERNTNGRGTKKSKREPTAN
jgi:hypothetical protein